MILINLLLYLSYMWNNIFILVKYLTEISEDIIDKNQFQQLQQKLYLPDILPNLFSVFPKVKNIFHSTHSNLTILNWNIHYFTDSKDNCTFINQFDYLKEKNPDIICLQEVKCKTFEINNEKCNQLKCIAEKLGYYYFHIDELAVLSRYKILQHKFISHYPTSNSFGNRCILFKIEINKKLITILNLHLHNDLFGVEQLSFYYKYLKDIINHYNNTKKILIICGDFNSIPFNQLIYKIKRKLQINNPNYDNYTNTFPTNYPIFQLDKCYSNETITNNITLIDSTPDTNCKFSDHLPLINQFLIK